MKTLCRWRSASSKRCADAAEQDEAPSRSRRQHLGLGSEPARTLAPSVASSAASNAHTDPNYPSTDRPTEQNRRQSPALCAVIGVIAGHHGVRAAQLCAEFKSPVMAAHRQNPRSVGAFPDPARRRCAKMLRCRDLPSSAPPVAGRGLVAFTTMQAMSSSAPNARQLVEIQDGIWSNTDGAADAAADPRKPPAQRLGHESVDAQRGQPIIDAQRAQPNIDAQRSQTGEHAADAHRHPVDAQRVLCISGAGPVPFWAIAPAQSLASFSERQRRRSSEPSGTPCRRPRLDSRGACRVLVHIQPVTSSRNATRVAAGERVSRSSVFASGHR